MTRFIPYIQDANFNFVVGLVFRMFKFVCRSKPDLLMQAKPEETFVGVQIR
jgi:hypothetical protein